jgi:hypothetical protein
VSGKVVNTKHVANKADGSLPDGVVYIGRRQHWGKHLFDASPFANYFSVKKYGRDESLRRFEEKIREKIRNSPALLAQLREHDGKDLACWCAGQVDEETGVKTPEVLTAEEPHYCHGQVLLKLLGEPR